MNAWICALAILLACTQPTSTRAYYKYVPPQPPAERYHVVETVKVTATKYIKPKRSDYASKEQFLAAIKLNGEGKETATGTVPHAGRTIAANFSRFKPGTIVRIKEIGMVGVIEDTGGAMRRNPHQIDIFSASKKDAEQWGKRKVTMEVLKLVES